MKIEILAIFKGSGTTRILGGFCNPYNDPCEINTLEYYDYYDPDASIPYPPPDSTKSYFVYSENLLNRIFRVCENEEIMIQYNYLFKNIEQDSMMQGII